MGAAEGGALSFVGAENLAFDDDDAGEGLVGADEELGAKDGDVEVVGVDAEGAVAFGDLAEDFSALPAAEIELESAVVTALQGDGGLGTKSDLGAAGHAEFAGAVAAVGDACAAGDRGADR